MNAGLAGGYLNESGMCVAGRKVGRSSDHGGRHGVAGAPALKEGRYAETTTGMQDAETGVSWGL